MEAVDFLERNARSAHRIPLPHCRRERIKGEGTERKGVASPCGTAVCVPRPFDTRSPWPSPGGDHRRFGGHWRKSTPSMGRIEERESPTPSAKPTHHRFLKPARVDRAPTCSYGHRKQTSSPYGGGLRRGSLRRRRRSRRTTLCSFAPSLLRSLALISSLNHGASPLAAKSSLFALSAPGGPSPP